MTNLEKIEKIKSLLDEVMNVLEIEPTVSNEGTSRRVAKMWVNELFANVNNAHMKELKETMTVFPNEYQSDMVIVRDIDFNSTCEHHFLPFSGKVTIGYVPNDVIIGLSKLPRVVKYFSKKPQLQEKLTTEIGEFLIDMLEPHALFVEVEATHQCVKCRGAESDCSTITYFKMTRPGFEETYQEFKERRKG